MLSEDINSEMMAIENYKYHISIIDDKYIKKLLHRIIADEEFHVKLFREMYNKYEGRG
jgi:bacterioferritin